MPKFHRSFFVSFFNPGDTEAWWQLGAVAQRRCIDISTRSPLYRTQVMFLSRKEGCFDNLVKFLHSGGRRSALAAWCCSTKKVHRHFDVPHLTELKSSSCNVKKWL